LVDRWIDAFENSFVQSVHIVGSEGGLESCNLVQYTAERPDVTLAVVWFVTPHFWRRVVRCACLGVQQTFFRHFRHIQVAKLRTSVLLQKDICAFKVAMEDVHLVEHSQGLDHLHKYSEDLLLSKQSPRLLTLDNLLVKITVI